MKSLSEQISESIESEFGKQKHLTEEEIKERMTKEKLSIIGAELKDFSYDKTNKVVTATVTIRL